MKTRVLHLTAELWPFARTGGLGQAVADLADHQAASGMETHVVLPLYREAREHAGKGQLQRRDCVLAGEANHKADGVAAGPSVCTSRRTNR